MIVTAEQVQLQLSNSKVFRSPGIHLSSIIRCIATETGILKQDWIEELDFIELNNRITDPVAILRISLGLAWEEWYIPQLQDVVDHPGECQFDGIYMTPDAESMDLLWMPESLDVIVTPPKPIKKLIHYVHEIKCTYKSTKTVGLLQDQWMWLAQLKAYCLAKGTRHAKLHVLFVCGDYKFPIKPQLWVFTIEFQEGEREETVELMKDYVVYRINGGIE